MPPPPINVGQSLNAPVFAPLPSINPANPAPIDETANEVPGNAGQVPPAPEAPPDPALSGIVENGVGPDLQPGNGQAVQFGAVHSVTDGRDWDMNTAEGLLETVRNSVDHIKEQISGQKAIDDYVNGILFTTERLIATDRGEEGRHALDADAVAKNMAEIRRIADEFKTARAGLLAGISEGKGAGAIAKLDSLRKTLRVFRFETQKALGALGYEAGKMEFNESNLRSIQNAFTFGIDHHVGKADIENIQRLEHELEAKLGQLQQQLAQADDGDSFSAALPKQAKFFENVGEALELSHRTNDQIRAFQESDSTAAAIRDIIGSIVEKGGKRQVEFTVGVGALAGLGLSDAVTVGVRAGARVRIVGIIEAKKGGRPITATFRIAGGLEAKGTAAIGGGSVPGVELEAKAGGEVSHFTTRVYPTLDDFILDAKRNKFAMSRTAGAAILGAFKSFGKSIGSLGTKFFRWVGRRSGEVRENAAQYIHTLKARGIINRLDRLLPKRVNPNIVSERSGWTWGGYAGVGASMQLVKDYVSADASVEYSHERDFKVKSKAYATLLKTVVNAPDTEALERLCGRDPHGALRPIERYEDLTYADDLYKRIFGEFAMVVNEAKRLDPGDKTGFARCAFNLRAVVLSTELAVRENRLSRDDANKIFAIFANMDVKFPEDIYREYFMVGTGAAKPPKVRDSVTMELGVSFFSGWTDGMTGDIGNEILKEAAEGGVKEMRHQIGIDSTFKYSFSSERPVDKNADPRPWENVNRTTHSLTVSASTPARIIIEALTRSFADKTKPLANKSESVALDTTKAVAKEIPLDAAKGALLAALPGLILSSVKASAVAAVKNWLSNPENVSKLVDFAIEHMNDAFDFIVGVAEWVADHPNTALHIAASIAGMSSTGDAQRNKVVSWSYVDGHIESISVKSTTKSKIGIKVDPVGVGAGLGIDVSYSVTETTKDRTWYPDPPFKTLLSIASNFLVSDTGFDPSGAGAPLKNWLSKNVHGVEKMLAGLFNDVETKREIVEIYNNAQLAADGDWAIQEKLQTAWRQTQSLPPDATLDAKVDAVHDLLVGIVTAYNRPNPDDIAT